MFYAVKKWAPRVVVTEEAAERLLGSSVLTDVRYTQIWFDLLTSRSKKKKTNVLASGEALKNGEFTIQEAYFFRGASNSLSRSTQRWNRVCSQRVHSFVLFKFRGLIESAREFEAEASLLSQLNHQGIVKLEDFLPKTSEYMWCLNMSEATR